MIRLMDCGAHAYSTDGIDLRVVRSARLLALRIPVSTYKSHAKPLIFDLTVW